MDPFYQAVAKLRQLGVGEVTFKVEKAMGDDEASVCPHAINPLGIGVSAKTIQAIERTILAQVESKCFRMATIDGEAVVDVSEATLYFDLSGDVTECVERDWTLLPEATNRQGFSFRPGDRFQAFGKGEVFTIEYIEHIGDVPGRNTLVCYCNDTQGINIDNISPPDVPLVAPRVRNHPMG